MFPGRNYLTRIPEIKKIYHDEEMRKKDKEVKNKMKEYADNNRNVKASTLHIDDTVLVKQTKLNKLTSPFNPDRHTVVAKKGSMITARSNRTGYCITRNSSFFKKIPNRNDSIAGDYENYSNGASDLDDQNYNNDIGGDNGVQNEANTHENDVDDLGNNVVNPEIVLRRNPIRERNRPSYLQDDIQNLLDTASL